MLITFGEKLKETEYDLVIERGTIEKQYWADLWRFRELFYFLAWKDILVRYKQTIVGLLWSILRPLFTMLAFVLVFNKIAKLESHNAPYPIMVFVALLPWQLFSSAVSEASNSLVGNANLISKVYFPRLIIPSSAIIVSLIDFLISFLILLVMMIYYNHPPTLKMLFLPVFLLLVVFACTGVGVWLSALNVKYRDTRYVVPFLLQFGLYVSPVGFSSGIVPEKWKIIYNLNPMVSVIDGFRWCLIPSSDLYLPGLMISILMVLIILLTSIKYFRSTEKTFADRI